jgi:pentatricopeptide repeat protein
MEAAMKATEILNNMRESYETGNSRLQPNSHCYNTVLDVWANQGNPIKAEEVFLLMCQDLSRGNSAAKPLTSTYNSKFRQSNRIKSGNVNRLTLRLFLFQFS